MRLYPPIAAAAVWSGWAVPQQRSDRSPITLHLADTALAPGAPATALRVNEIVLKRDPDNVAAMVIRGDALQALGQGDAARCAYCDAIGWDQSNGKAHPGLGCTLIGSDPAAAEAAFLTALNRDRNNDTALNDLGVARDPRGDHDAAQSAYRRAWL